MLLCEDREIGTTYPSLRDNLLHPLQADLAIFGVRTSAEESIPYAHQWVFPEPQDWTQELVSAGIDLPNLAELASINPMFLGGVLSDDKSGVDPKPVGSGAIILYWRYQLGKILKSDPLLQDYQWIAITRSDFVWSVPHPPLSNLEPERVYFLDGERYGGVSDRFVLFHRSSLEAVAGVCDTLFEDPGQMLSRLRGLTMLNPEIFLQLEWERRGVMKRALFLPYIAYAIRSQSGVSRWSLGRWNEQIQAYVKYSSEFEQAYLFAFFIRTVRHWGRYPGRHRNARVGMARAAWKLFIFYSGASHSVQHKLKIIRRKGMKILDKHLPGLGSARGKRFLP